MKHAFLPLLWVATSCFSLHAGENWQSLFEDGQLLLDLNFRLELVDQDSLPDDALASTLRSRFGFRSGEVHGLHFFVEAEDVTVLGPTRYNDTKNGFTTRPVVADPADTEINRLQLVIQLPKKQRAILGRQRIILDNARWIGNVGWRQNEQTFDAARVLLAPRKELDVQVIYLANVNRIFGENHPSRSDSRMDSWLGRVVFAPWRGAKISVFAHFLDFSDQPQDSHQNLGFYAAGQWQAKADRALTYGFSWARQDDYRGGSEVIDAQYHQVSLGSKWGDWSISLNQEFLEGDGQYALITPLATGHAFNGWADVFLSTPVTGLVDRFISIRYSRGPWMAVAIYHDFESDAADLDYGSEWDAEFHYKPSSRWKFGAKLAIYEADQFATDRTKLMLFSGFKR